MANQQMLLGAGGKPDPLYVNDVFHTHIYKGDSSSTPKNITGSTFTPDLVWIKGRSHSSHHLFVDSVRGTNKVIYGDTDDNEDTNEDYVNSLLDGGFKVGNSGITNGANETNVGWTFKKQEGFFTCFTYSGNSSSSQTVTHDLGSVPGIILVKNTGTDSDWAVYHRGGEGSGSNPETFYGKWNTGAAYVTSSNYWNDTAPTSSVFTVGSDLNSNGATYMVYMFAHDDQRFGPDADSSIVKCGYYTGNNSDDYLNAGNNIDLGWEPQWVFIKCATNNEDGRIFDDMRGVFIGNQNDSVLKASTMDTEATNSRNLTFMSNGFKVTTNSGEMNQSGRKYNYVAIRRPDGKVGKEVADLPSTGGTNKVFELDRGTGNNPSFISNWPVDMAMHRSTTDDDQWYHGTRGGGPSYVDSRGDSGGNRTWNSSKMKWDYPDGAIDGMSSSNAGWLFRRAPKFFDVVHFMGDENGNSQTVPHGLGCVPEMMWIMGSTGSFSCYHKDMANRPSSQGSTNPAKYILRMNKENQARESESNDWWNGTQPTATQFSVGTSAYTNDPGKWMTIYLFASVDGVCKVGSYKGNNSSSGPTQTTGFTPRFIYIKRFDSGQENILLSTVNHTNSGGLNPDPSNDGTGYMDFTKTDSLQSSSTRFVDTFSTGFKAVYDNSKVNSSPGNTWYSNYMWIALA